MTRAREWMDKHGIDYQVAADAGIYADPVDVLHLPTNGFERIRDFRKDGKSFFLQPKGTPLRLFWPLGSSLGGPILLCEGESDTLAAASILAGTSDPRLDGLCPVGLPGASTGRSAIAELEGRKITRAYLAMDADQAGERATTKLRQQLPEMGITPYPLDIARGDLSEWIGRQGCSREEALARLVAASIPKPLKPSPKPKPRERSSFAAVEVVPPYAYYEAITGDSSEGFEQYYLTCPCADHEDYNPSCKLYDTAEKGWYCYGCGRGGDIYNMAMEHWGLSFVDAAERLEHIYE